MSTSVKESLEQINQVSRQLLSRIQDMQNILQESLQSKDDTSTIIQETYNELTRLISIRQSLITHLFEQNSTEEIKTQHLLINEMKALDTELSIKYQTYKHALADQLIKFKKSKKAAKSYKQY